MPNEHSDEALNCPFREDFGYTRASIEIIRADIAAIKKLLETQNGRIRKLENWRNMLAGAWILAMIILGIWIKLGK